MNRTILCFGDSNTHGTKPMPDLNGAGRFDHAARWPSVMGQALGQGFEVISEGHPGRTTVHDDPMEGDYRNGIRVLPALLESHKAPWRSAACLSLAASDSWSPLILLARQ